MIGGKKFEVGKTYGGYDGYYIHVTRRTEKTIWVDNNQTKWFMRIKYDKSGNEYVIDSSCPRQWYRWAMTYEATREIPW